MRPGPVMRAVFGAFVLVGAVSAGAQIAPGQSGHSTMSYFGGDEAWDTLREFGECYASTQRTNALKFVSTRPDSVEERAEYVRQFSSDGQNCLSLASELRVPYQMVRGVVAEGLYRRGIAVPASLAVNSPPALSGVRNFMDAALCFTAGHREQVRTLLATTKLGTKAENDAVGALMPAIGACIPAAARQVSISSPMIRVRLAEAMWRLGESANGQVAR